MAAFRRQHAVVAFVVGVALIAVALAIAASGRSWQRVGYDNTPVQLAIGTLPAGAVGCQPREPLPAGTRAVRLQAVAASSGPVAVRIQLREAGRLDGTGPTGTSSSGGTVVAALAHPTASAAIVSLCVWNTGRAALALQGAATGPGDQLKVALAGGPASPTVGRVRIEDLNSPHPSSLWSVLGKLPERVATATGSELAPWLVAAGAIGMLLAAAALLLTSGEVDENSAPGEVDG